VTASFRGCRRRLLVRSVATVNSAKIDLALELAHELNDVAKRVPVQVDTLISLIRANAWTLRLVGSGPRTTPEDVATHLRSLQMQLAQSEALQRAVAALIPDQRERELVAACRDKFREFYEQLSEIPKPKREGELNDSLRAELNAIIDRWPRSRFLTDFLNDEIDSWFHGLLGDTRWLVRIPSDDDHAPVRQWLSRALKNPDAASPMEAWQLCPVVCQACWYALKDRMRQAKSVPVPDDERIDPRDLFTKKEAAALLKIDPAELTRYLGGAIARWAEDQPDRFRRLLREFSGRLVRPCIQELADWREARSRRRP